MANKAPPTPPPSVSMKRSQIESQFWRQSLLSAQSLGAENLEEGEALRRGHMCVLPPSDLDLMTPERETCSGCSFWVNYTTTVILTT